MLEKHPDAGRLSRLGTDAGSTQQTGNVVPSWRAWSRSKEYTDAAGLQAQLSLQATYPSQRLVYVFEGPSPKFMDVLCRHFRLSLLAFNHHERFVPMHNRASGEGAGLPFLPSTIFSNDHVSLKYHEPMKSTQPTVFRNVCDVSSRHIAATRLMGRFSEIVTPRRKCTFWSKMSYSGGWDCRSSQGTREA